MAWVVDTCLVIDVLDADPEYGAISADLLDGKSTEGLFLCPVSFIELAPAFGGELKRQEHFLRQINVDYTQDWTWVDRYIKVSEHLDYLRKETGWGKEK